MSIKIRLKSDSIFDLVIAWVHVTLIHLANFSLLYPYVCCIRCLILFSCAQFDLDIDKATVPAGPCAR
jgi:hypothetical protein